MEEGENLQSPSTKPHADGRPTYLGCGLVPQRESLTTLPSLPQCHAVFSTISSTLAWVDQIPISQLVVVTFYEVSPAHLVPPPT